MRQILLKATLGRGMANNQCVLIMMLLFNEITDFGFNITKILTLSYFNFSKLFLLLNNDGKIE